MTVSACTGTTFDKDVAKHIVESIRSPRVASYVWHVVGNNVVTPRVRPVSPQSLTDFYSRRDSAIPVSAFSRDDPHKGCAVHLLSDLEMKFPLSRGGVTAHPDDIIAPTTESEKLLSFFPWVQNNFGYSVSLVSERSMSNGFMNSRDVEKLEVNLKDEAEGKPFLLTNLAAQLESSFPVKVSDIQALFVQQRKQSMHGGKGMSHLETVVASQEKLDQFCDNIRGTIPPADFARELRAMSLFCMS